MTGTNDAIGLEAMKYLNSFGQRAPFRVDDDISAAIGQRRWDAAHHLNRVRLRLSRLMAAGQVSGGSLNAPAFALGGTGDQSAAIRVASSAISASQPA